MNPDVPSSYAAPYVDREPGPSLMWFHEMLRHLRVASRLGAASQLSGAHIR